QNHVVDVASDGTGGLEHILYYPYDLIVLDWNLPGLSGLDICSRFRESGGTAPVLFLTASTEIPDRVKALDSGADDYLCKPFSSAEFLARVRALLRRPVDMRTEKISAGTIELDLQSCKVDMEGSPLELNPAEYALLELFMKNQGKLFRAEEIIDKVFKLDADASPEALRQRIMRLRKKIDGDRKESFITTVKGLGYRFDG
ncbi:MAG: response regulator transcription factor, partial [Cyanobacteria bacterium HKST-UBA02]|nr:response regulator transcription factor [Cyanobacteria bacterium HKST-UBA02]